MLTKVLLLYKRQKKLWFHIPWKHCLRVGHQHETLFRTKWSQILANVNVYAHVIKVCELGGKYKCKFKYKQMKIQIYTNINSAVWGKPFAI